jgi:hypothetical protein
MDNYGGISNMHNKLYYIIAEFVPVSFDAGSSFAHANIEHDNILGLDTIMYSKYIKPPHCCTGNQMAAHVILGFTE